jgi:hypothetical protein
VSTGIDDAFLRKYDAAGSDQWTEQFGTAAGDVVWALSPDGSGGVYVAGRVGDSAEGAALPGQASAGLGDAFVRNYDSSGNPGFTEQFGSSGDDSALAVYAAPGVVLLAGSTGNALPGQSWFGGVDAFVTRLLR